MDRPVTDAELYDELGRVVAKLSLRLLELVPLHDPESELKERPSITAKELARMTTLSEKTIYRDARLGKLKSIRIGHRVMFTRDDIDEWISSVPVTRNWEKGNDTGIGIVSHEPDYLDEATPGEGMHVVKCRTCGRTVRRKRAALFCSDACKDENRREKDGGAS